jgi:hypothetical protein
MARSYEPEIRQYILDAVQLGAGDDGMVSRQLVEETAFKPGTWVSLGWDRYQKDHPGQNPDDSGADAIAEGLRLEAADTISWLVRQGYLDESDGHIRLSAKRLGSYVPGTVRENDLLQGSVLRTVTPARVNLIRESMQLLGDLRAYFPILLDEDGEIVDGRHRHAIDPDWPAARTRVPRENRAIVAMAANRSSAWPRKDWDRLREVIAEHFGRQAASGRLARLALLENHERSDRDIAKLVGASPSTVGAVRRELEDNVQLGHYSGQRGRPRADGQPAQPREKLDDHPGLLEEAYRRVSTGEPSDYKSLMELFGVTQYMAQKAVDRAKERARGEAAREAAAAPAAEDREPDTPDASMAPLDELRAVREVWPPEYRAVYDQCFRLFFSLPAADQEAFRQWFLEASPG